MYCECSGKVRCQMLPSDTESGSLDMIPKMLAHKGILMSAYISECIQRGRSENRNNDYVSG